MAISIEQVREKGFQLHQQSSSYQEESEAILSGFTDVVLLRDYDGRCLKILSAPPGKIYRPASELLGKTLHEGLGKSEADAILSYIRKAIETQQAIRGQYELMVDGKLIYFSATFSPIETDRVLIVTHDVTELREVEKQLEIHALITKNIGESICVTRAVDGTIIYTNPQAEEMFGYEPCELIGEKASILQYGHNGTNLEAEISDLIEKIEQSGKLTYETHNVRKNGEDFWSRATTSTLFHSKYGKVLIAIQTDITADRRTRANIEMLSKLTEDIDRSKDFETALQLILREVSEADNWIYAEAWIPCLSEGLLKCSPVFYVSQRYRERYCDAAPFNRFRKLSETFAFGVGLPGRVYASQAPEWQEDVSKLPQDVFLRQSSAAACGFHAGLGIPLVNQEKVIAVLAFFKQEATKIDRHLVTNLSAIASQLASKDSYRRLKHELSQKQDFLRAALNTLGGAILISDNQGQIQYANSLAKTLIGYPPEEIEHLRLANIFKAVDKNRWQLIDEPTYHEIDSSLSAPSASSLVLINQSGDKIAESTKVTAIKSHTGKEVGTLWAFQLAI